MIVTQALARGDLKLFGDHIKTTVNAVLGAFSGAIAIALIVLVIFYFVKLAANANNVERRARYMNSIKWVGISFVAVLIIWGVSSIAINLMEAKLTTTPSTSSFIQTLYIPKLR
ncbi:Mbov_0395 family pilin-like conjugal transfer protein [Mycoplasmopsis agassizii]|uniref:Uncharacterized protein n=1 Tax=Mycoplasmopsis agassizii TaxID=33922 RepID=A0ABX4H5F3_9BACT|nr:pilin [Mycoplasmopsis agassizii]PAF55120.1 hypothetical protein CJF60_00325 [Mycoplasmopsis agassizii]SMC16602.1 hypothetical protein SAMN02745179_00288 [Mycoplasmopsis agassizii]